MMEPAFSSFEAAYQKHTPQLVWARQVTDTETPVSALIKLFDPKEPCFLLESVLGGEMRGRYSILGLDPDLVWQVKQGKAELSHFPGIPEPQEEAPLDSLKKLLQEMRLSIPEHLPPMASGLIGYMGYHMAGLVETLPRSKPDSIGIPDACFMRPKVMVIFDSVKGESFIVTPVYPSSTLNAEVAYSAAKSRIEAVLQKLHAPLPGSVLPRENGKATTLKFQSNLAKEAYSDIVQKAKEHIHAGDIFQAVLSQRFTSEFTTSPLAFYRALRHLNPSPFLFFLHFPEYALIGSSPEILVRLRDNKVTIRPIAGTRKRGATKQEDERLAAELLADPKERAEHLMLLDLGRNDVGKAARPGSVCVTETMNIERYSHVMHIVSNVEGDLAEGMDALDALLAGFPAGTVSGAPKIRAMEIIDSLEPEQRSFYAGSVGYFSAGGGMDTCITLRTALLKDGKIHLQAGGGVVYDSSPEGEYQECLNKAKALMRAAEEAAKFEI